MEFSMFIITEKSMTFKNVNEYRTTASIKSRLLKILTDGQKLALSSWFNAVRGNSRPIKLRVTCRNVDIRQVDILMTARTYSAGLGTPTSMSLCSVYIDTELLFCSTHGELHVGDDLSDSNVQ
jgi:hypothetical protein